MILHPVPAASSDSSEAAQVRQRTKSRNQASANLPDTLSGRDPSDFRTNCHPRLTASSHPPDGLRRPSLALNTNGIMGDSDHLSRIMSHGQSSANPPHSPDGSDSDESPVCLGSRPAPSRRRPIALSGHHRPSFSTVTMDTQHRDQALNRPAFSPINGTGQRSSTGNRGLTPRPYDHNPHQAVATQEATNTYRSTLTSNPYPSPYGGQTLYSSRDVALTSPYENPTYASISDAVPPVSLYDTEENFLPQNPHHDHLPEYATGPEQADANTAAPLQPPQNQYGSDRQRDLCSHHHRSQAQQPIGRSRPSYHESEVTQASRGGRQQSQPASYQSVHHHHGAAQQKHQSQFQPLNEDSQRRLLTPGRQNSKDTTAGSCSGQWSPR